MPEARSITRHFLKNLINNSSIIYILIYTAALRGSNVAILVVVSHLVDPATFGQISAVYVFVMSGAQIIGLPLIALALKSTGAHCGKTAQESIIWWAAISLLTITACLIFILPLNEIIFSRKVDAALIVMGCFWMCAMGLEIISGALAASSGKLKTMATGGVLQAAATVTIVPAAVWLFGKAALVLIPVSGMIVGAIMVARVFDWRGLSVAFYEWRRGATSHLTVTMGPAAIAALSVTSLNMALVSVTATSPGAYLDLAIFAIALQLVGVSTFIPQVLSNSALEGGHRAARDGRHWRKTLAVWACVSLGVSGAIGAVLATFGGGFALLYPDGYALPPGLMIAAGLLVALIGPVSVLSHILIIGGRQWLSAAICFASTVVVIGCFVIQPSRSSEAMLWAMVASNAIRFLALSGFAALELHQIGSLETVGKAGPLKVRDEA